MEVNNLSYEESMKQLEEILLELEEDDKTLAESLDKFKKGIELYKHCSKILTKAEGEVKVLLGDKESLQEIDFFREIENEY